MIPIEEIREFILKEIPHANRGVLLDTFILILQDHGRPTYQQYRKAWIRCSINQQLPLFQENIAKDVKHDEIDQRNRGKKPGKSHNPERRCNEVKTVKEIQAKSTEISQAVSALQRLMLHQFAGDTDTEPIEILWSKYRRKASQEEILEWVLDKEPGANSTEHRAER